MKCALIILAGLLAASASAQYAVNWYKVAGGGSTISNSQYTVNATIGQHDAGGPLTNGIYSLTGGFWYMAAQTPGAPKLRVFLTTTNTVVVAWPASSTGFRLEQKTALNTTGWSTVTNVVNMVNSENQVTIFPLADMEFYRLIYP
jgi:hypothetical protein